MDGLLELSVRGEIYLFLNDFTIKQINEIGEIAESFFAQEGKESDEQLIEQLSHEINKKLGIHLRRMKITKVIAF